MDSFLLDGFIKMEKLKTYKDVDGGNVVELARELHPNLVVLDTQLVKFFSLKTPRL